MNGAIPVPYPLMKNKIVEVEWRLYWSNERGQLMRVGGAREFDASALLSAKVKAMIQRLDHLNVNIASSSA